MNNSREKCEHVYMGTEVDLRCTRWSCIVFTERTRQYLFVWCVFSSLEQGSRHYTLLWVRVRRLHKAQSIMSIVKDCVLISVNKLFFFSLCRV